MNCPAPTEQLTKSKNKTSTTSCLIKKCRFSKDFIDK